eukprot:9117431-Pyramimonas_sp.AAC.1
MANQSLSQHPLSYTRSLRGTEAIRYGTTLEGLLEANMPLLLCRQKQQLWMGATNRQRLHLEACLKRDIAGSGVVASALTGVHQRYKRLAAQSPLEGFQEHKPVHSTSALLRCYSNLMPLGISGKRKPELATDLVYRQ